MGKAKNIEVKPIASKDAKRIIRNLHYSGKTVNNSQVHFGVFFENKCGGALQFGPPLDKRKLIGLVEGTKWNEFIELNRMALADWLPRNGESRSISLAMKMLKKHYPWLKWVVSFADATQCGDGTIYRASNFVLTGIKKNDQIWEAPTGEVFNDTALRPGIGGKTKIKEAEAIIQKQNHSLVFSRTSLTDGKSKKKQREAHEIVMRSTSTKGTHILNSGASSMKIFKEAGWRPKPGFQLRYIYFLDQACRDLLTVPAIPFSKIKEVGASMYKGQKCAAEAGDGSTSKDHSGGSTPARPLQAM